MNLNVHHCFLLDGKINLPINHSDQFYRYLKFSTKMKNKSCSTYQRKSRSNFFNHYCQYYSTKENLKANNNNKDDLINNKELCSYSLQTTENIFDNQYRNNSIEKRNICKFDHIDQQNNNNETYCIQSLIPSINFIIESNQIKKTPSAITIIIKPFECCENCQKGINSSSSCSAKHSTKRISTSVSHHTVNKHRLSTFKDLIRTNLANSSPLNNNENKLSNILQSKTLLDIYRNKKNYTLKYNI